MATKSLEVAVTVNINGSKASKDVADFERRTTASFGRVGRAGAAVLGFFYGGIAQQAGSAVARLGDLLGRGTGVGGTAAQYWGRVGAANTAADRTVETFGIAGQAAGKDQILAVYNMHRMMETMRADSKARVENVVGAERNAEIMGQAAKDLKFVANKLGSAIERAITNAINGY